MSETRFNEIADEVVQLALKHGTCTVTIDTYERRIFLDNFRAGSNDKVIIPTNIQNDTIDVFYDHRVITDNECSDDDSSIDNDHHDTSLTLMDLYHMLQEMINSEYNKDAIVNGTTNFIVGDEMWRVERTTSPINNANHYIFTFRRGHRDSTGYATIFILSYLLKDDIDAVVKIDAGDIPGISPYGSRTFNHAANVKLDTGWCDFILIYKESIERMIRIVFIDSYREA